MSWPTDGAPRFVTGHVDGYSGGGRWRVVGYVFDRVFAHRIVAELCGTEGQKQSAQPPAIAAVRVRTERMRSQFERQYLTANKEKGSSA